MKTSKTLIFGSLLFISVTAFAQDKKTDAAAQGAAEKGQAAMMAYMTPGPMHKMLADANGEWTEEVTFWMAPDAPPQKEKSMCSNSMIMGGRYQESFHKGNMMGMPFEGRSIVGYDNAKKVFQSMWIDNMGSGMMNLEGKYDAATKSITFTGKMVDPSSGKEMSVREVIKFIDDRNQLMEMYMTNNGKEFKTMEIKSKKRLVPGHPDADEK